MISLPVWNLLVLSLSRSWASGRRLALPRKPKFDLMASYLWDEAVIHYRYEVTAHFIDDHNTVLGCTTASVQITVRTNIAVDETCIEQFGGTSGALMAHPYLREAIASTAQRIGFPGVLLPMIKHQPAEPDKE
jgi:hypothetical protein